MDYRGRSTVVGLFQDDSHARQAVEALKDAGFRPDDLGFLARDRDRADTLARETGTEAGSGAATGAVGGGILGGLAGWLVGVGAIAIPGIGPFIAAGALGTALAGAAIGAGVGAVAGALVGMGIPKEEAEWYEGEVKGGRTLVTVRANGRYTEARSILRRHGAYDIENREPDYVNTRAGTTSGTTMGTSYATEPDWTTASPRYRSHWQSRYGRTGAGQWEAYEPSYRYGWEMQRRPEYRGRSWSEVEPEFRRDWETRHRDMPWDRAAEWVRDAWENVTDDDRGTRTSTGFEERGFRGGSTATDRDREERF